MTVGGASTRTFIVAELSANHHQDLDEARALVRAAASAGADAVKLQTYTPDTLTLDADRPWFRVGGGTLWDGRTLYELYGEAFTPWEWHPALQAEAGAAGLEFFSTAFDATAVEFLESLNVPRHKVASFELVDLPLVELMARTGKPLILSTGMATETEIEEAVETARAAGARDLTLLKCNSAYPAPPEEMNLLAIPAMKERFGLPLGLSDHTPGLAAAVAAVALGSRMVEKHLTLSRARPGPDSAFSLEPDEFKAMVDAVRTAERALGQPQYGPTPGELKSLAYRRSLFVVRDIAAGERLTADNVRSIRPANGLPPKHLRAVLGRRAARALARGTPLAWGDLED